MKRVTLPVGAVIIDALTGQKQSLEEERTVELHGPREPFGTWLFDMDGHPYEVETKEIPS